MPGFYAAGEYDVAGTIVGAVDREQILDGSRVRPRATCHRAASAGLHTNGYSLARKILFEDNGQAAERPFEGARRSSSPTHCSRPTVRI